MNHRRLLAILASAAAILASAAGAGPAQADFGLSEFDVQFNAEDATPAKPADDPMQTQAGSHPFALTTTFEINYTETGPVEWLPDEAIKDLIIDQVAGLSGDTTTIPRCPTADFQETHTGRVGTDCSDKTVVGVAGVNIFYAPPIFYVNSPIYNLEPPPGVAVRLGFSVIGVPQIVDVSVKQGGDYNVVADSSEISRVLRVYGAAVQLWGVPADPAHDPVRGDCLNTNNAFSSGEINYAAGASGGECPAGVEPEPFLTLPTSCTGPVETRYETDSWLHPGSWLKSSALSHNNATPPEPQGFTGCGKLGFKPEFESKPTTDNAETGTGLDVNVDFHDEGLNNPEGLAQSTAKKAEVTLPEGVTINPSVGEGLGVCTPADYARESLDSAPGEGCPNESKIGTLQLDTPSCRRQLQWLCLPGPAGQSGRRANRGPRTPSTA